MAETLNANEAQVSHTLSNTPLLGNL